MEAQRTFDARLARLQPRGVAPTMSELRDTDLYLNARQDILALADELSVNSAPG